MYKVLGLLLRLLIAELPSIRLCAYRIIYRLRERYAPPPTHKRCGDCPYEKGCKYEMCALSILFEREKESKLKGANNGREEDAEVYTKEADLLSRGSKI